MTRKPNASVPDSTTLWTRDFASVTVVNLFMFIAFQTTQITLPLYADYLGADSVVCGLMTTIFIVATLAVRPFSGIMLDRFGRKGLLITVLAVIAFSMVAYAVFPLIGVILMFRVLHGFAWSISTTACAAIAADVVPRRRFTEGMGYFGLSNALAMAIAPTLATLLFYGPGPIIVLVLAVAFSLLTLGTAIPMRAPDPEPQPEDASSSGLARFFERKAVLPGMLMLFTNFAFGTITTFIAIYAAERGITNVWIYFLVYAVVMLLTRPGIGKLIDRRGYYTPSLIAVAGVAATMVIIAFAPNAFWYGVAGAVAGLGFGTTMSGFQAMAAGTVHPSRRALAMSTYLFCFDTGLGLGALLAGVLAKWTGSYCITFCIMAVGPVVAGIICLIAGRERIESYHA